MDLRELDRGEITAALGGALIFVSLFLGWYHLHNSSAILHSCRGAGITCTGWHSLEFVRYPLVVAAAAPLVLIFVVVRGTSLGWPKGELTAVIALCALTLIVFRGIIDKPGYPTGEIGLGIGWFIALIGGLLMFLGAVTRANESNVRRNPPGVL
jgi:hypothetical protein